MFELANASVFLDFDGTITTRDVGVHLLERVGAPEWRSISEQYSRGEIGSRECSIEEWALIRGDEDNVARRSRVRCRSIPGSSRSSPTLRAAGAEVMVVSDGFGFYVDAVCAPLQLPVLTNTVDFATGELVFPHEDRCCPCSTCGVCKQAPIKDARQHGRDTVLVGDGISDRKAALLADVVFAKGSLAVVVRGHRVPVRAVHHARRRARTR